MEAPHGRTQFLDGMRVTAQHLDNLQDLLHLAALQLRQGIGVGLVAHGLKVEAKGGGKLAVGVGLAFDTFGRALLLAEDGELTLATGSGGGDGITRLVIVHQLKSELLVRGIPTILTDQTAIETRTAPPPYDDGAVRFAELRQTDDGVAITQSGDWYLPPANHAHSGRFFADAQGRWRFDGRPLGLGGPSFDSGFVAVAPGAAVNLRHTLPGHDFLAALDARRPDGTITTQGLGQRFWYDLPEEGRAVVTRDGADGGGSLELRLRLWPCGATAVPAPGPAPAIPVADAGDDATAERGASFVLDGGRSQSPAGTPLARFVWTQLF